MDEETEAKSKLVAMHDLHHYSDAWMNAITKKSVGEALGKMIGPNVEVHHSTMHIKPSSTGHPFPMHQDQPFYAHEDL
jgi:phytanoyl-CoA hydroxylase